MRSIAVVFRHSARSLLRAPGFSVAVVATLALALGPGVALLSIVEQIFWRPLPVAEPERLVVFQPPTGPFAGQSNSWSDFSVPLTYPEYRTFARWQEGPFTGVAARAPVALAIAFDGTTDEVVGEIVSGNYFDVLGVRAERGRLLTAADDVEVGGHPVVVLSWGGWQRRFGGDPNVVGRSLVVNGQAMTVLGVAARGFRSLEIEFAPELWLPMAMKPVATPLRNDLENPRSRWLNVVARLAPGVSLADAENLTNQIYRRSSEELAPTSTFSEETRRRFIDRRLTLLPGGTGRSDLRGDFGRALFAVLGLVGLLLALACANLANLFAARATRHERELTVRLALGASRGDLVRRILAEALILSAVAAALGLALVAVLARTLPARLVDQPGAVVPEPSALLVGCALGLALAAALGSGLLPALASTRGGIAERLRSTAGAALGGHRGARTRRILVGVQVALSASILIGAGLLVRSLASLADRDAGVRTGDVVLFRVDPRLTGLSLAAEGELVDRLERELAGLPGVASVARAETTLLESSIRSGTLELAGFEATEDAGHDARFDTVSPAYFETLGIPLRSGRGFTPDDRKESPGVALVNEKLARDYYPAGDAVGRRFRWGGDDREAEIVGVVGNVLSGNLRESEARFVYVPWAQAHDGSATTFYVRARSNPAALVPTLRRKVAEVAPGLPVVELRTLEEQARRSLRVERITASLASALGGLAALLAAIGLYGILAYTVDARRRELALRSALGAAPAELGRWVIAHAAVPVVAGLAVGVAAALGASGILEKLLFGIAPRDPATFGAVVAGLLAVALAAALVPTRRALAIEPASALREE